MSMSFVGVWLFMPIRKVEKELAIITVASKRRSYKTPLSRQTHFLPDMTTVLILDPPSSFPLPSIPMF